MIKIIKSKPLIAAILLNTIWLGLSFLLCDSKYEISDDFVIASVLSGGYGQYTSFAPFLNICLNKLLFFLYTSIPNIGWLYIYEIALGAISFTAVTYVLLREYHLWFGGCLSVLVLIFFADDIYLLPSFTKVAAMAVLAGGFLIIHSIWQSNKFMTPGWIIGTLLLVAGSLLRYKTFYLGVPFLGLFFLYKAAQYYKEKKLNVQKAKHFNEEENSSKQKRDFLFLRNLILCAMPVCIIICASIVHNNQWNKTDSNAQYKEYNSLRSSVIDTATYGYESVQKQYQELGLDDIDYWMIEGWNFMDLGVYTPDKLSRIASIKQQYRDERAHKTSSILQNFYSRNAFGYWPAIGALVLFVLIVFFRRINILYTISLFLVSVLLLLYLYWINRVVYRVEYGIIFGMALGLLVGHDEMRINHQKTKRGSCAIIILFLLVHSLIYLPDLNYQTMSDAEYRNYRYNTFNGSGSFGLAKYWVNANQRRAYPNLIDLIETDDVHYYLFDFKSTIQRTYYDYKPWEGTPLGFYDDFSYLGGITNYFPANQAQWKKRGIDPENPLKSVVNDNILVVDTVNQGTRLAYLRKYYYPNARMECVGNVDGYQIWKYYVE